MDNNKEKTREELELEYIKFRLEGHKTPRELRKVYRDLKRQGLIQKYGMELLLFILYPKLPLYLSYVALGLSGAAVVINLVRLILLYGGV